MHCGSHPSRSAHTLPRTRSTVAHVMLTELHGPYLPSWSAKLPLWMEKTGKQRLLWKRRSGSRGLIKADDWACSRGSVTCPLTAPLHVSGPSQNTPMGSHICSSSSAIMEPTLMHQGRNGTCCEISTRKSLVAPLENRQELPRRGGMETSVAHTFSPFGPVLPGSPGGPYTIKTRSEESTCQTGGGQVVREAGLGGRLLRHWASPAASISTDSGFQGPHKGPPRGIQPSLFLF